MSMQQLRIDLDIWNKWLLYELRTCEDTMAFVLELIRALDFHITRVQPFGFVYFLVFLYTKLGGEGLTTPGFAASFSVL